MPEEKKKPDLTLDVDRQRELLKELGETLLSHADIGRLEEDIRSNLTAHDIQADEKRVARQASASIHEAAHEIHGMMLEILRDGKVIAFKANGRGKSTSVSLGVKATPIRRRQIQSLKDAAASGSDWKWTKAWDACPDELRYEIHSAAVRFGSGHHQTITQSPRVHLPGTVPSPERILPLLDLLPKKVKDGRPDVKKVKVGKPDGEKVKVGRPDGDIIKFTIGLILDKRQFLAQDRTWGINPSKTMGIKLVCEIFRRYGASEHVENQSGPKEWLFEATREFREYKPGNIAPKKIVINALSSKEKASIIPSRSDRAWDRPKKKKCKSGPRIPYAGKP